ncbi:MAG TPA: type IV toxin-antitoxin system AbiEi family antitoxin domain-containing protein [Patescibacteria group bacterium]|nr:type IV toxin-antitoxin system AbiEi family antitoxin domain-containing protein [Patescibacteria group bacterium]
MNINNDLLLQLYSRPETVFTVDEIAQLCTGISYESLRDRLYYFVKAGKLNRVHHGIYAKPNHNIFEMANKIYKPSYISLETVLVKGGVVFQYYETIFLVSYLTRYISVNNTEIQYRQLKGNVLADTTGIEHKDGYFIASLERAFLDSLYIYKNYHFDNLGPVNWEKVEALKSIYNSKALEKRIKEYYVKH